MNCFNIHFLDCLNLLLTSGASADAVNETGFTPLHAATENGHHGWVLSSQFPRFCAILIILFCFQEQTVLHLLLPY